MNIKRILLFSLLTSAQFVVQPIAQSGLDKALETCCKTVVKSISNNPWTTIIGLGAVSALSAAYCYKPYTLIAIPENNPGKFFVVNKFKTLSDLKKATFRYHKIEYQTIYFYQDKNFVLNDGVMTKPAGNGLEWTVSETIQNLKKQFGCRQHLSLKALEKLFENHQKMESAVTIILRHC